MSLQNKKEPISRNNFESKTFNRISVGSGNEKTKYIPPMIIDSHIYKERMSKTNSLHREMIIQSKWSERQ